MIALGPFRNQILAAGTATLGAFGLGAVLGYTALGMPSMEEEIAEGKLDLDPLSDETKSWIGSVVNLGALASAIFVGILVDIIGRKLTMLILSPPFVAGWLLIIFAQNHAMLIAGRFITGFCGGAFSLAAPLFIAEMADDGIRGALGSAYQIMAVAGILFSYVFGTFLNWKWLAIVSGIIPLVFALAMVFIPDSPRYLVAKGKTAEASRALCWFKRKTSSQDVKEELKIIEDSVRAQKALTSSFGDLFLPYHMRPSLLMIFLMISQPLSGIMAVLFYTGDIFESTGSDISSELSTTIVGIVQFFATVSTVFFVDKVGRKVLLMISAGITSVFMVVLGVFFQLRKDGKDEGLGWLPLVSLMIIMVFFSMGYGPVPWVMLGELIPQKVKARVASLCTVINWGGSFLVTRFFQDIQDAIGIQWCYWIFAIICAINFIFVFFFLPETKGKSMEEIERHFGVPQATPQERRQDGKKM